MSGRFDIKEFNDAWRIGDPALAIGRWINFITWPLRNPLGTLKILTWPFRHPHKAVKAAEPWGILFAVLAFSYEIYQRGEDRVDRQRDLIDRSWTRIHSSFPENAVGGGGLRDAVETLASLEVSLSKLQLQEADLEGANLRGANLKKSDLGEANLSEADLQGANLHSANFENANLQGANLQEANTAFASFTGANLKGANLSGAGNKIDHADVSFVDLLQFITPDANRYLEGAHLCRTKMPNNTLCDRDCEIKIGEAICSWFDDPASRYR